MSVDKFISNADKTLAKKAEVAEVDIEKEFCSYAKSKRCIAFKLILLNRRGFPDRTVFCPGGLIMFVEFKRKGKKRTAPQNKIRDLLIKLGFTYVTCDEQGQAEEALDDLLF